MKISVIIPLYNKEKFCLEAILSVLNQSYKNIELIIIDDGSTDNSKEIALSAIKDDSRARLIIQSNQGVSAARNNGVKNSKYEYLAFLDADDLWHPLYLENMVKTIQAYPEQNWFGTNILKFSGDFNIPSLDKEPVFKKLNYFRDSYHRSTRLKGKVSLVYSDSFIISKALFNKIGGYPLGISYSEDIFLYRKIALNSEIIWTSSQLAYYRQQVENQAVSKLLDKPLADFIVEFLKSPPENACKEEIDFMAFQAIRWVVIRINRGVFHDKLRKLPLRYMLLSFVSRYFRFEVAFRYLPAALLFLFTPYLAKWYLKLTSISCWFALTKSLRAKVFKAVRL